MKHIMVLFLSLFRLQGDQFSQTEYHYKDGTAYTCVQTNESAVRYVQRELSRRGETIDTIFYFASQGIQKKLTVADQTGQEETLSHEEWFRRRICEYCPSLNRGGAFAGIPYDESADTEEGIRQIAAMAQAISAFVDGQGWSRGEVVLHADMTGGLRHASMMMLAVMQLLKYSGIQTRRVLYSNWQERRVEDVTDIYRTFSLVSGADEFIHFGSVQEIESYFSGKENSRELTELIKAMQDFADAIKICRVGNIEGSLQTLYAAMETFCSYGYKTLQEELFMKVLAIFRAEYGDLLTEGASQIDIIKWCVKKGYLQQAMTLCTEWLPEQIVHRRICYPASEEVRRECQKEKTKSWKSWELYFIVNFNKKAAEPNEPGTSLRNLVAAAIRNKDAVRLKAYPEVYRAVRQLIRELGNFGRVVQLVNEKNLSVSAFSQEYPYLYRAVRTLWQKNVQSSDMYTKGFFPCIKFLTKEKLFNRMDSFSADEFSIVLDLNLAEEEEKRGASLSQAKTGEEKWAQRKQQYQYMLDKSLIKTDWSEQQCLDILHGYHRIRTERNAINHASAACGMDTAAMNRLILSTLQAIQEERYHEGRIH